MQIQIPTADLKSALHNFVVGALSAEQQLSQNAQAQVQALVEELYPLVISQTQALLTANNPAVPQAYLSILEGVIASSIAKLSLQALATQRTIISNALQTGIQMLVLLLKAAVVG